MRKRRQRLSVEDESGKWSIVEADVLVRLSSLPSDSYDAIFCDPPYGILFQGKAWDRGVPSAEVWREALRVLKPGGHVLAFGGTRTYHRMVCNMEDAGLEIRDCLIWLYGTGYTKSLDISKAIDKAKNNRKEVLQITTWVKAARDRAGLSNEDINRHFGVAGMAGHWASVNSQPTVPTSDQWVELVKFLGEEPPKEIRELVAWIIEDKGQPGEAWHKREVVGEHKYAMDPFGQRPDAKKQKITTSATAAAKKWEGHGTTLKPAFEPCVLARKPFTGTYAEHVQIWGTGTLAIDKSRIDRGTEFGGFPANIALDDEAAAILDAQSGEHPGMSGGGKHRADYAGGMFGSIDSEHSARGDSGGSSRFFFTAKVSKLEREFGSFKGLPADQDVHNDHPTLKRIDLNTWLAGLILPPATINRTRNVLVPYSGAASEIIGALRAGWDRVDGIEHLAPYIRIAQARLARWHADPGACAKMGRRISKRIKIPKRRR